MLLTSRCAALQIRPAVEPSPVEPGLTPTIWTDEFVLPA
jgi:hypothetical protein